MKKRKYINKKAIEKNTIYLYLENIEVLITQKINCKLTLKKRKVDGKYRKEMKNLEIKNIDLVRYDYCFKNDNKIEKRLNWNDICFVNNFNLEYIEGKYYRNLLQKTTFIGKKCKIEWQNSGVKTYYKAINKTHNYYYKIIDQKLFDSLSKEQKESLEKYNNYQEPFDDIFIKGTKENDKLKKLIEKYRGEL